MTKAIFKAGDTITSRLPHAGLEYAVVKKVGSHCYYLSIPCGTVLLPISAQTDYRIITQDNDTNEDKLPTDGQMHLLPHHRDSHL